MAIVISVTVLSKARRRAFICTYYFAYGACRSWMRATEQASRMRCSSGRLTTANRRATRICAILRWPPPSPGAREPAAAPGTIRELVFGLFSGHFERGTGVGLAWFLPQCSDDNLALRPGLNHSAADVAGLCECMGLAASWSKAMPASGWEPAPLRSTAAACRTSSAAWGHTQVYG